MDLLRRSPIVSFLAGIAVPACSPSSRFSARASDPSSLSDFGVDVVGQGMLADQSILISDLAATALTRMEAQAQTRDPAAKLDTIQFFTLQVDAGDGNPRLRQDPALPRKYLK
jgi:hypothetical protein